MAASDDKNRSLESAMETEDEDSEKTTLAFSVSQREKNPFAEKAPKVYCRSLSGSEKYGEVVDALLTCISFSKSNAKPLKELDFEFVDYNHEDMREVVNIFSQFGVLELMNRSNLMYLYNNKGGRIGYITKKSGDRFDATSETGEEMTENGRVLQYVLEQYLKDKKRDWIYDSIDVSRKFGQKCPELLITLFKIFKKHNLIKLDAQSSDYEVL